MHKHGVLCSSIGKVYLTVILKQESWFEVGRMSNCVIQLFIKSYCNQSHINRGALCRIREVIVPSKQLLSVCHFFFSFQFFILKIILNLHCIMSVYVPFILVHQLLTFYCFSFSLPSSSLLLLFFFIVGPFESKL